MAWCNNDWITFDFGGNSRRTTNESINLKFNSRASSILDPVDAGIQTAKLIYKQYSNIYVAMSGGCDSEFVADCFIRAGVDFTPVMFTCEKYLDIHKWYVDHWCKKNHKQLEIFDMPFDMYMYVAKKKATTIRATNGLAVTSSIVGDYVKSRGGHLVTGAMPAYWPDPKLMLGRNVEGLEFEGFYIDEDDFYIELADPGYHPWSFAYHTPEMLLSIINAWNTNEPVEENKWRIFNQIPRPKLNGGEMIFKNVVANSIPEYKNKIQWALDCRLNSVRDFFPIGTKQEILQKFVNK